MARNSNKKIIEQEPITVDEKEIISGEELSNDEVIDVEAPEVIIENQDTKTDENASNENQDANVPVKKLICKVSFTDKFDKTTVYEVGKELNITDVARRNDLIRRGLAVEE